MIAIQAPYVGKSDSYYDDYDAEEELDAMCDAADADRDFQDWLREEAQ